VRRLSVPLLLIMMWLFVGGTFLHTVEPRRCMDSFSFSPHKITILQAQQPQSESHEPFLTQRLSIGFDLLFHRGQPHNQGGTLLRDCTRVLPERHQQVSHFFSALLLPTGQQFFFPRQYYSPSADDDPFPS
jgi:hypothetical protein